MEEGAKFPFALRPTISLGVPDFEPILWNLIKRDGLTCSQSLIRSFGYFVVFLHNGSGNVKKHMCYEYLKTRKADEFGDDVKMSSFSRKFWKPGIESHLSKKLK